jgi:hypothetical protein
LKRLELLPAIAAIPTVSAATTTIAAAATTTAASVAATATTASAASPATTAASVAAATTTASAPALSLWLGLINNQVTPAEILAVQGIDGFLRVFIGRDFDEGESAGLAGETVTDEGDSGRRYTDLREPLMDLVFRRGKWEVAYVELLHLRTPFIRNPRASRGAR